MAMIGSSLKCLKNQVWKKKKLIRFNELVSLAKSELEMMMEVSEYLNRADDEIAKLRAEVNMLTSDNHQYFDFSSR